MVGATISRSDGGPMRKIKWAKLRGGSWVLADDNGHIYMTIWP